jgi:uncharacterized protein YejL (UPF0352 family)
MSESRIASELVAHVPKHSVPTALSESRIASELVALFPKHSVPTVLSESPPAAVAHVPKHSVPTALSESRIASELVALFPKHSVPTVLSESSLVTKLVAHVPKNSFVRATALPCSLIRLLSQPHCSPQCSDHLTQSLNGIGQLSIGHIGRRSQSQITITLICQYPTRHQCLLNALRIAGF